MSRAPGRQSIFVYTDEDVSDRLAVLLQDRGYKPESALSAGTAGFSDEQQLLFAAHRGWTILTFNVRDFMILAQRWRDTGREHAGIVVSRQFNTRQTGELLRQVCSLIDAVPAREMWDTVRNLQSYRL